MLNVTGIGLTVALLVGGAGMAAAQGSASTGNPMPDSNMGRPSGHAGAANNGIGNQGSLTGNAGSHWIRRSPGRGRRRRIPVDPKPATGSPNDPKLEEDPAQGGSRRH